jgi:hypothetical protein
MANPSAVPHPSASAGVGPLGLAQANNAGNITTHNCFLVFVVKHGLVINIGYLLDMHCYDQLSI